MGRWPIRPSMLNNGSLSAPPHHNMVVAIRSLRCGPISLLQYSAESSSQIIFGMSVFRHHSNMNFLIAIDCKYIAPTDAAADTYTRYLPPVKCLYAKPLCCTIQTPPKRHQEGGEPRRFGASHCRLDLRGRLRLRRGFGEMGGGDGMEERLYDQPKDY